MNIETLNAAVSVSPSLKRLIVSLGAGNMLSALSDIERVKSECLSWAQDAVDQHLQRMIAENTNKE